MYIFSWTVRSMKSKLYGNHSYYCQNLYKPHFKHFDENQSVKTAMKVDTYCTYHNFLIFVFL